ncbi:MAG: cytochrome c oxidase subunit 3 [Gammaproteobacteria bacterium]|nr:cytochrome c oxidase subunit 3 [Gammaproteobacteria bacterium]NNC96819.1 cytochrome c oxidase subunit 3 [Gammaproteobacteria bacterium]NNM12887.1 cytochrome c oxidase subunit 3 [Gammaproteobacteria bacterium]
MAHAADYSKQYYVPHSSRWPIIAAVALFIFMIGAANWLNGVASGKWVFLLGLAAIIYMIFGWGADVIRENNEGINNLQVDRSYRMGIGWFIFSEVMFFAGFFGALFYARQFALPWLAGDGNNFFTNFLLHSGFEGGWPSNGPEALGGEYKPMGPFPLPTINTILLISSSFTITIAHHAMLKNKMDKAFWYTVVSVLLGFLFVGLQAFEYYEAYAHLNLRMETGIYGSTFFMLTGFHGLHVTLGATLLTIMAVRIKRGHFTPERHFGFLAAEWYWHFVDVVWIMLYFFVYWM